MKWWATIERDRSGPVPLSWGSSVGKRSTVGRICWKGRFWAWSETVMKWWMTKVGMMTEMIWEVDEEVNRDENGEADEMNLEVDSKDMHI